jgi:hypothetical protein
MISVEVSEEPDSNWNENLLSSKYGTVYQTIEYSQYVESRIKSRPIYLKFVTPSGKLAGQLLVFQSFKGRGILAKHLGRGLLYSLASKASPLLPKYTYWSFGPVVSDIELQDEISEFLGHLLTSWKGKFNGVVHPLNSNFDFPQKFNFIKNKEATFVIDLSQKIEEILKNSDKNSVQKNIRRSQERGVSITQIDSKEDLLTYYNLLNQHRSENNLSTYSMADVVEGYETVKKVGQTGFLAWHEKTPIGGIFISSFNGYINEWGIARSKLDTEKKLYSLDLLRWYIIEWGKKNNCNYYDLSGVKISNRATKEDGIFRNKEKWGGRLTIYPIFSNQ